MKEVQEQLFALQDLEYQQRECDRNQGSGSS